MLSKPHNKRVVKTNKFQKPPGKQVSNPQHRCLQLSKASKKNGKFPSLPGRLHTLREEAQKVGVER